MLAPKRVLSTIRQAQQEHGHLPRQPGRGQRAQENGGKAAQKGDGSAGHGPAVAPQRSGTAKGYGKGPRPSHGKGRGSDSRNGQGKGGKGKGKGQGGAQQGASPQQSGEAPVATEQPPTLTSELQAAQALARALPDDTRVAALLEELKAQEEPPPKPEKPQSESAKLLQAIRVITKLQTKLAKQPRALEQKQEQRAQLDQDIAQLQASSTALAEQLQEARNKAAKSLAPSPKKAVAQCSREALFLEKVGKFIREF